MSDVELHKPHFIVQSEDEVQFETKYTKVEDAIAFAKSCYGDDKEPMVVYVAVAFIGHVGDAPVMMIPAPKPAVVVKPKAKKKK